MAEQKLTKHRGALAALLVALAVASGCGADRQGAGIHFQPDLATWRLPVDSYYPPNSRLDFANSITQAACFRKKTGLSMIVDDPANWLPPVDNTNARRLFSLSIAERWGYHAGPDRKVVSTEWHGGHTKELEACGAAANKEFGLTGPMEQAQGIGGAAYDKSLDDPKVLKAGAAWRSCMLPLGIEDLPQTPDKGDGMPTQSQRRRLFGSGNVGDLHPGEKAPKSVPESAAQAREEIKEAIFDAKCRASSGYTTTVYLAEVDDELALIKKHSAVMSKALAQTEAMDAKVDAAIKAYGR